MSIFKNRIFIIVLCLLLTGVIMVAYAASFGSKVETVDVVTVKTPIKKGELITDAMLDVATVGSFGLSNNAATEKSQVLNNYALADFSTGDLVLSTKVSEETPLGNEKLSQLTGEKLAISITLKNFASGLSDKLYAGDIVSCISTRDEQSIMPTELTYLEVVTTTYQTGFDKSDVEPNEQNIATVTVLVTPQQAILLANYEQLSAIHFALAYRGSPDVAEGFLQKQAEAIAHLELQKLKQKEGVKPDAKADNNNG